MSMNPADRKLTDDQLIEFFTGDYPLLDSIGFYFDEHVHKAVVDTLREQGVSVERVYDQLQNNEKADTCLLARARELGYVFVTYDQGLKEVHERIMTIPGLKHLGVIIIKSGLTENPDLLVKVLSEEVHRFEGFSAVFQNQVVWL